MCLDDVDLMSDFDCAQFQPKRQHLLWPVLLRAVFVPLFLICNYQPKDTARILPIYINNDWLYWFIGILMAYTSGYFRFGSIPTTQRGSKLRVNVPAIIEFFCVFAVPWA